MNEVSMDIGIKEIKNGYLVENDTDIGYEYGRAQHEKEYFATKEEARERVKCILKELLARWEEGKYNG